MGKFMFIFSNVLHDLYHSIFRILVVLMTIGAVVVFWPEQL